MPGLIIHDGYTLEAVIPGDDGFPGIKFRYRPAMPDALNEWRVAQRATGRDETTLRTKFVEDHLADWDVTERAGVLRKVLGRELTERFSDVRDAKSDDEVVRAPIHSRVLRCLPDKRLNQLFDFVAGYARQQEQETDAKN